MKTIALCIICKDENEDLKENIDYHTLLGVDHFIIYDDGSKNPLSEDFKNYKNVTVNPWSSKDPHRYQQRCYESCVKQYKNDYKWIGFIDTDEFIVIKNDIMDIKEFLIPYEKYGGLGIQWKCFGSSGHIKRQKSTIKSYIHARPNKEDRHIKSIVNPRVVIRTNDPHSFRFKEGYFCVNENEERIIGPFNKPSVTKFSDFQIKNKPFIITRNKIQLNHYVTRSEEDFKLKAQRGDVNCRPRTSRFTTKYWEQFQNGEKDTTILDFIKKIKNG